MKEFIQDPDYGEIIFTKNAWTGKRTLTVNDVMAKPISRNKKEFKLNEKMVFLKGNTFTGISLYMDGKTIQLTPKPMWYEIALAIFPVLFIILWGNVPSLFAIFPVIGGAFGGAIGAVGMVISLYLMKKQNTALTKVFVGAAASAVTIFIAFILAVGILLLLA